jgi:hypothetical protein
MEQKFKTVQATLTVKMQTLSDGLRNLGLFD